MVRVRRRFSMPAKVMVAALVALVLVAAPAAATGPPLDGSGTGFITGLDITSVRMAGGNSHQTRVLEGQTNADGPLDGGSFVQEVSGTVHGNGHVTFRGTLVYTGPVEGCGTGTVTLGLSGRGVAGDPQTVATVRVIKQPTNTLAVTGQGTVTQNGRDLSYDIKYQCR